MKRVFFFLVLVSVLATCGFAYKERITGRYYIVSVDTEDDLHLSYLLPSGDFIGKAPGKLLMYGYNDSFIVAKTLEVNKTIPAYYVIDRRKDGDYALEEDFRIGPLIERDYMNYWNEKLHISFIEVKAD